jgi:hypothetical protein
MYHSLSDIKITANMEERESYICWKFILYNIDNLPSTSGSRLRYSETLPLFRMTDSDPCHDRGSRYIFSSSLFSATSSMCCQSSRLLKPISHHRHQPNSSARAFRALSPFELFALNHAFFALGRYLLGSGGTFVFDITIVTQFVIYKGKHPRRNYIRSRGNSLVRSAALAEETAGLLRGDMLAAARAHSEWAHSDDVSVPRSQSRS